MSLSAPSTMKMRRLSLVVLLPLLGHTIKVFDRSALVKVIVDGLVVKLVVPFLRTSVAVVVGLKGREAVMG